MLTKTLTIIGERNYISWKEKDTPKYFKLKSTLSEIFMTY